MDDWKDNAKVIQNPTYLDIGQTLLLSFPFMCTIYIYYIFLHPFVPDIVVFVTDMTNVLLLMLLFDNPLPGTKKLRKKVKSNQKGKIT